MKHIVLFLTVVYVVLFLSVLNKQSPLEGEARPVVRIFGYSSFVGSWGPGPKLKEIFEKTCQCRVEFIVASDNSMLLQKLKLEGKSLGADLVVGFDQFDLQKALTEQKWQKLNFSDLELEPELKGRIQNDYFVPYDWGILAFMGKKGEAAQPTSFNDLLAAKFKNQIALQDPRTSSPGFHFVWWVLKTKGDDEGYSFLQKMMGQAHSWSPSWSTSIGIYNRNQANYIFTYVTSPLYYSIEEKNDLHRAYEFAEPHPIQIEFSGIPVFCRQCELGERFLNLMLSAEGQKIIMEKNYMFPVLRGVRDGTPFANSNLTPRTMTFEIPSDAEVESILKRWSDLRRNMTSQ